ncbi:MAG: hypothetical protein LUQ25_08975 [Methanoregulaceae archaeon]|nr:hypothetical protein [Methanoregulaceae archaeon]
MEELSRTKNSRLLRCLSCATVSRAPARAMPKMLTIKTIVSREGESRVCETELSGDEVVEVGDQLAAECGEEVIGVEVAGIESGPRRVTKATATDISALWTRAIEEVTVHFSVHDGRKTVPLMLTAPGEEAFTVGEEGRIGKYRFRVTHIKLRDGALLRKEGWRTVAKKIKRIYAAAL